MCDHCQERLAEEQSNKKRDEGYRVRYLEYKEENERLFNENERFKRKLKKLTKSLKESKKDNSDRLLLEAEIDSLKEYKKKSDTLKDLNVVIMNNLDMLKTAMQFSQAEVAKYEEVLSIMAFTEKATYEIFSKLRVDVDIKDKMDALLDEARLKYPKSSLDTYFLNKK